MASNLDRPNLSAAVQRIAQAFRMTGWISLWIQGVLAVVSTLVLLFSTVILQVENRSPNQAITNPGAGAGVALAIVGIIALYVGVYWSFRYTRLSRALKTSDRPPTPKALMDAIRIGLIINMVGMFITLLGGEALVGSLFAKALSQPQSGVALYERITQAVQPIDILVVQANTNTVLAHFVGLAGSLWLLRSLNRS
ncbi:DUF3611 family protein [Leptolyngbya sp. CCY15150]|uniref:DUF3611 family protein n=1 Tax=Leptolyngbya sp. CCY15150 TaxID=2767772 RepID=UPI001950E9CE|nr:DUF3611 family protein [Leptolyngbya sp. CCY15150]